METSELTNAAALIPSTGFPARGWCHLTEQMTIWPPQGLVVLVHASGGAEEAKVCLDRVRVLLHLLAVRRVEATEVVVRPILCVGKDEEVVQVLLQNSTPKRERERERAECAIRCAQEYTYRCILRVRLGRAAVGAITRPPCLGDHKRLVAAADAALERCDALVQVLRRVLDVDLAPEREEVERDNVHSLNDARVLEQLAERVRDRDRDVAEAVRGQHLLHALHVVYELCRRRVVAVERLAADVDAGEQSALKHALVGHGRECLELLVEDLGVVAHPDAEPDREVVLLGVAEHRPHVAVRDRVDAHTRRHGA
ncbi:hypothetical protein PybrP1_007245 [[Pythium] brassicae (nom. inval.)]|nr:hypothetical protein PybrP1_007245 [[Pythium] brassicae (nom. inval.)]